MSGILLLFLSVYFSLQLSVPLQVICLFCIVFVLMKNRKYGLIVVLLLMLMKGVSPDQILNFPLSGIVIKANEASFVLATKYGHVQVISDEQVLLDTVVSVDGSLLTDKSGSHFYEMNSSTEFVMFATELQTLYPLKTLRSWMHQKCLNQKSSIQSEFLKKVCLRITSSMNELDVLSSLQIMMLIRMLRSLFFTRCSKKSWNQLELVLLMFFCWLWWMPFVLFRFLFFKMMNKLKIGKLDSLGLFGVVVFLLSSRLIHSASFWYVFVLRLCFYSLGKHRSLMVFFMALLHLSYSCCTNLVELVLFPLIQYNTVISFFIGLCALLFDFSCLSWITTLQKLDSLMPSIELRGYMPLWIIIVIILLYSQWSFFQQSLFSMSFLCFLFFFTTNPISRVVFLNAGQGDSILIRSPLTHTTILIDTGPPSFYTQLKRNLYAESVKEIDLLIITHKDSDHAGNRQQLCNDFLVHEIWDKSSDQMMKQKYAIVQINELSDDRDDNENSLVHVMKINGLNFLFCADASTQNEKEYVTKLEEPMDVCKIGHHGSNTSTSWTLLDGAQCSIAVISAGIDNRYGHPHKEVLERLKRNGSMILNTQVDGDIRFSFTRFFNLITTSSNESVIIFRE